RSKLSRLEYARGKGQADNTCIAKKAASGCNVHLPFTFNDPLTAFFHRKASFFSFSKGNLMQAPLFRQKIILF
ncbi:MAG TPA: hypothetical protein VJ934_11495, partial [Desulfomicrobiaceae bacterium]|nr:hypothetical protein [Desulfomicrobiaceae bacterium]